MTAAETISTSTLQCTYCSKEFKYESEKKRHEESHFPHFKCKVCSKKFSFISSLRRHEKQHERSGNVKCEVCGGSFRDDILLKRHINYAHKGTHTCPKCNATYNSETALRTHMKTHKPESERKYRCSYEDCNKSFNFHHHLKHHELVHLNKKQHFCNICSKGFIQLHHLKTHLKSHDPKNVLICDIDGCKKKFTNEYSRKRHLGTHKKNTDNTNNLVLNKNTDSELSVDSIFGCDNSIGCHDSSDDVHAIRSNSDNVISQDNLNENKCTYNKECVNVKDSRRHKSYEDLLNVTDKDALNDVDSCKVVLGGCISGDDNCLCAEITSKVEEPYDLTPVSNNNLTQDNYLSKEAHDSTDSSNKLAKVIAILKPSVHEISDDLIKESYEVIPTNGESFDKPFNVITQLSESNKVLNKYDDVMNCEGCECAASCKAKNTNRKEACLKRISLCTVMPTFEYVNGALKLKGCDMDISTDTNIDDNQRNAYDDMDTKFVPYNSCKAVLGNCIVSGDGTIGEGCLCARMMIDDQVMAEEIDDITPQPNVNIVSRQNY